MKSGSAGARDTFQGFKLNNTSGQHWHFLHNGTKFHEKTFSALAESILPFGNSEVDNACDWAGAHFKNLEDKGCDTCEFKAWRGTAKHNDPLLCCENPCFHPNLISNTEFGVDHGPGENESC